MGTPETRRTYPLIDLARTNIPPEELGKIRRRNRKFRVEEALRREADWIDATGRVGPHQYQTPAEQ